jgi:hypothetical protein
MPCPFRGQISLRRDLRSAPLVAFHPALDGMIDREDSIALRAAGQESTATHWIAGGERDRSIRRNLQPDRRPLVRARNERQRQPDWYFDGNRGGAVRHRRNSFGTAVPGGSQRAKAALLDTEIPAGTYPEPHPLTVIPSGAGRSRGNSSAQRFPPHTPPPRRAPGVPEPARSKCKRAKPDPPRPCSILLRRLSASASLMDARPSA